MKIGIDFDEVIADSVSLIVRMHNERYGTNLKKSDITSYKFEEVWGITESF